MTESNQKYQSKDAVNFAFIGPSGGGKSSLKYSLCELKLPTSTFIPFKPITTREKRPNEDEYRYVSDQQFDEIVSTEDILFTNEAHGNRYATPRPLAVPNNSHYIFIYVPEAALELKKHYPNTKIVLILPPSLDICRQRLIEREPDISDVKLNQRLEFMEHEVEQGKKIADIEFVNSDGLDSSSEELANNLIKLT